MAQTEGKEPPTSTTLQSILGLGFRTTLLAWRETTTGFDSLLCNALNNLRDEKVARENLDQLRRDIYDLGRQIESIRVSTGNLREVLEIRKAEAEYKAAIVNSWPPDVVAERATYFGAGVFASGGVAYALTGYPALTLTLVPSALLWLLGAGLVTYGLWKLVRSQREKFDFFTRQFNLEIAGKV